MKTSGRGERVCDEQAPSLPVMSETENIMDNRAIGVFDSGLGGLTATVELMKLMPDENIIYLGDSYNMPYGERKQNDITRLALWDMDFLLKKDVKAVFIACGTATSNAIDLLSHKSPVPVVGVVEPAVREAIATTKIRRIGLLATSACVESYAFQRRIYDLAPEITVTAKACPKFAGMVEQGIFEKTDPRVREACDEYLPELMKAGADTIILGCTHYPMLSDVISEYMGRDAMLISSGAAAARSLKQLLVERGLTAQRRGGSISYYTTGEPSAFASAATLMLKHDISDRLTQISPLIL